VVVGISCGIYRLGVEGFTEKTILSGLVRLWLGRCLHLLKITNYIIPVVVEQLFRKILFAYINTFGGDFASGGGKSLVWPAASQFAGKKLSGQMRRQRVALQNLLGQLQSEIDNLQVSFLRIPEDEVEGVFEIDSHLRDPGSDSLGRGHHFGTVGNIRAPYIV